MLKRALGTLARRQIRWTRVIPDFCSTHTSFPRLYGLDNSGIRSRSAMPLCAVNGDPPSLFSDFSVCVMSPRARFRFPLTRHSFRCYDRSPVLHSSFSGENGGDSGKDEPPPSAEDPPPPFLSPTPQYNIIAYLIAVLAFVYFQSRKRRTAREEHEKKQEMGLDRFVTQFVGRAVGLVRRIEFDGASRVAYVWINREGVDPGSLKEERYLDPVTGESRRRLRWVSSTPETPMEAPTSATPPPPSPLDAFRPDRLKNLLSPKSASPKSPQPSPNSAAARPADITVRVLSRHQLERAVRRAEQTNGVSVAECLSIAPTNLFSWERVIRRVIASTFFLGVIVLLSRRARMMSSSMADGMSGAASEMQQFTQMGTGANELSMPIRFSDVAGLRETKAEVMEFVDFFHNSDSIRRLGAIPPKGAIFFGPPGVGKTLIAKAIAGEADVPFYSVSGSDFVEMYVGVGAARVRDLFEQARQTASSNESKGAIIFIDEIDAIGRPRGLNAQYGGGSDERQNTLNQLLLEMDGFGVNENIIVLGATNVGDDGLDGALLRKGRFDKQIMIGYPDRQDRIELFELYIGKIKEHHIDPSDVEMFADLTVGCTGADIATIVNESGILAVRDGKTYIEKRHVEDAIQRIGSSGNVIKKAFPNHIFPKKEKLMIAVRETAKAVVSEYFEENSVNEISLSQKGNEIGFTEVRKNEVFLRKDKKVRERMVFLSIGRLSEVFFFNEMSNLSANDLSELTQLCYSTVSTLAMNEDDQLDDAADQLGPLSHDAPSSERMTVRKTYSEDTARRIDEMVLRRIEMASEEARLFLEEKKSLIWKIANLLVEKESLSGSELREILAERVE